VRPDTPLRSPAILLPTAAKLLVHPAIVAVAVWAAGVEPFAAKVAVLAAALPSAGWVFIFAQDHRADAGRIAATILVTTALAFLTFSLLVWALGVTPPAR
ncbi:MAG TPA: AEC family transporter, partial [Usitatibacteraceae bacterium]|nr:AEC family transporter [Usitatibacteraceae bacterium]